jgi:hypothetical protein
MTAQEDNFVRMTVLLIREWEVFQYVIRRELRTIKVK